MSKFQIPLFLIALATLGSHAFPLRDHNEHDIFTPDHAQQVVNHQVDSHDHDANATHNQAGHVAHPVLGDRSHGQNVDSASHAGHSALANHFETSQDLDHIALAEMHTAVLRYLGEVHELPGSFGTADTWSHEWTLRWNDYTIGTNTIRIYHATNRHNYDLRYTWLSDSAHGHDATWHPTH